MKLKTHDNDKPTFFEQSQFKKTELNNYLYKEKEYLVLLFFFSKKKVLS